MNSMIFHRTLLKQLLVRYFQLQKLYLKKSLQQAVSLDKLKIACVAHA